MPVVVRPDPSTVGRSKDRTAETRSFFRHLSPEDDASRVHQTSVTAADARTVAPLKSGFVQTVLRAWQQHLHLELRPDDVWLAVLVQLSFFVNGRPEALRTHFVAHEGKKKLVVDGRKFGSIEEVDMGFLTDRLVEMAGEQMVDPGMAAWLLPTFSTTLPHDRLTAAAVFLGTMKQYFDHGCIIDCGFPSVTLHGERGDWADLARRVAWLAEFDDGAGDVTEWSRALAVAVGMMVETFDRPEADDVVAFWTRACHSAGSEMSGGVTVLSGWLTAFCWWRADGGRQKAYGDEELRGMWQEDWRRLRLRGVAFPVIDQDEVPVGASRVPVTFYRDGEEEEGGTETVLLAGSTGMKVLDDEGSRVRPFSSWWLLDAPRPRPAVAKRVPPMPGAWTGPGPAPRPPAGTRRNTPLVSNGATQRKRKALGDLTAEEMADGRERFPRR